MRGALVGYLARTGDLSRDNLRRAVVYGCTVASFNVEDFSLRRLCALTADEIEQRFRELQEIARF